MRFFLALILSFTITCLGAQLNDRNLYVDVQEQVLEEIEIKSLLLPKIQIHNYDLTDSIGFDPSQIGSQLYKLNYQSIAGLSGDFKTVIEYTEPSLIPGIPQTNYTVIHFRVKSSTIVSGDDYALSSGISTIDPLINDSSSDGPLSLVKLGHVSGGTASITTDNKIEFSLTEDSGTVLYFSEDSLGNKSSAYLRVQQENDALSYSKTLYTSENKSIDIILPSTSYNPTINPTNGTLSSSGHVWTYLGDVGYNGSENIVFESAAGGIIEYNLSVLNATNNNSFLVNDELYLESDGVITFDVLENDYRSDFPIIYHSPELTEVANGVFEYTVTDGFVGDLEFEYKVFTGLQVFTGEILIHVADFAPTTVESYVFNTIRDKSLRITHNTPIGSYYFETIVQPTHGTVQVFDEFDNELIDCDSLSGANTIIYTPDSGYTGADEFDIKYCTNTLNCEVVKVDLNVLSSSYTDCICLEYCVYEGDHNDDGRVDFLDILDLGLNVGESGQERVGDFEQIWTGQFSTDWGYRQMGTDTDLKCGDSDGDGYIDEDDLNAIDINYGKLSKFQSYPTTATTDIPVYFIPQQTEVDSGELLIIDIAIGDTTYPAIDMNGLAFSFNIAAELMDSSSVNFYLYDENWLAYNNPIVDYNIVPYDGRVDVAVTRLGEQAASGHGIIGALEFIVEDEVEGLKRAKSAVEQIVIEMNNIISVNGDGAYVSHPNYSQKVTVGAESNDEIATDYFAESISVNPNPTSGMVFISSSETSIDKIVVTDVIGRTVARPNITRQKDQYIDLQGLQEGVYFLSIHSGDQVATKKVHKVNL